MTRNATHADLKAMTVDLLSWVHALYEVLTTHELTDDREFNRLRTAALAQLDQRAETEEDAAREESKGDAPPQRSDFERRLSQAKDGEMVPFDPDDIRDQLQKQHSENFFRPDPFSVDDPIYGEVLRQSEKSIADKLLELYNRCQHLQRCVDEGLKREDAIGGDLCDAVQARDDAREAAGEIYRYAADVNPDDRTMFLLWQKEWPWLLKLRTG